MWPHLELHVSQNPFDQCSQSTHDIKTSQCRSFGILLLLATLNPNAIFRRVIGKNSSTSDRQYDRISTQHLWTCGLGRFIVFTITFPRSGPISPIQLPALLMLIFFDTPKYFAFLVSQGQAIVRSRHLNLAKKEMKKWKVSLLTC